MTRKAEIRRTTKETDITVTLNLDGSGVSVINTGIGFLDHMLDLFARHGLFDLEIDCKCDLHIEVFYGRNQHHITEAIFKAVTRALAQAVRLDERIQGVMSTKGTLSPQGTT